MKISEILSIGSNKRNFKELVMHCVDNNIVPFVGAGMSVPIYRLWNTVLLSIANKSFDPSFPATIQELLEQFQYEEAASCVLSELGEGEFYSELGEEFSKEKIRKTKGMAITILPKIFNGLVITTNFEKMLEVVYQQAENEFDCVTHHIVEGNIISELLTKGLTQDKHFLMKIHGDIEVERSLILQKEKYDAVYGTDTPFKQALMTVFESKQLLFLGCSLKCDRTMELYKEAKKINKVYSYAFVQKPNDVKKAQERSRELSNLMIHPIWYPEDDVKHESVKILLNYLHNQIIKEKKKRIVSSDKVEKKVVGQQRGEMQYDKVTEILAEQQNQLKREAILKWGSYDIENYGKMFTSFYVEPQIKNIRDGEPRNGTDIEKQILNMKKGNVILITGTAGCGKSCLLRRCFINGFKRRKKEVIAFWLSSALINERKPQNQFSFFKSIIKNKCTSKNKVIVFVDSVDEIFNNESKNILKFISELCKQKVCIVLGCRKTYYNRFLLEYDFTYIFEIQEWDDKQVKEYIYSYLESKGKKNLFDNIFKDNNNIKNFLINPFQVTLLMGLIGNGNDEKVSEIKNVYSLYQTFYEEWIFKERKRNSSFIEEKDIINIHYRIAKEFYKNYNKAVYIGNVLTKRQKELECHKDEAVLSLVRLREQGMINKYIAEGFLHESFCEFFISKNLIESLISGGIKIFNCFLVTYRHFELDFLEEGIACLPIGSVRKIKNNLERTYISLMPQTFIDEYGEGLEIDWKVRDKFFQATEHQVDIVRDQCIFYLGKLPREIIRDSKVFKWAYYHDNSILTKISAATVVINHDLDFLIERDYVMNLLNNELWEKTLRSWVLVFWGDVIYDEPYSYEDRGGNWSRIKARRLSRIQMEDSIRNIKYIRTRTIDLTQLYIFFRNRGWITMTDKEYNIICDCNCDLSLYSNEKKELLKYLKTCFEKAWKNKEA